MEMVTFKEKEEKVQRCVCVCAFVLELTHTIPLTAVSQSTREAEAQRVIK